MPESPITVCRQRGMPARPVVVLVVLVALVIGVVAIGQRTAGPRTESPEGSPSSSQVQATAPPFPAAPMSVTDRTTLMVPEEARFAESTFWARAGTAYLVTMDLFSRKPAGSGGRSMYLAVTLSCVPRAGGTGISAGGTQNMITAQPTSFANQGLIRVSEDGPVDCSVKASAPYDDVASAGTAFPLETTWRVEAVGEGSASAPDDSLPTTLESGTTRTVLVLDIPRESVTDGDLRTMTSLHLTTCTIVNGSREDGRAWCEEGSLHEGGSVVAVTLTASLLDDRGEVCAQLGTTSAGPDHIDRYRHHRLLSLDLQSSMPEQPCGDMVRVRADLRNDGPAPLVVHRSNSTLVVADD